MDRIIKTYQACKDDDLVFTVNGVVYQEDMSSTIDYSEDYFEHYEKIKGHTIAVNLNKARVGLSHKYCTNGLLDIGVGSGEFIENCQIKAFGYDINPFGVKWLKDRNIFLNPYDSSLDYVDGITLWDTLEHIPEPHALFDRIESGKFLFVSIPIFKNLSDIRKSKHYKPNEHYYYFTHDGFVNFMKDHGFELLEFNDEETRCGREGIESFAFRK